MSSCVQITDLVKKYPSFCLSINQLAINEGEVFGLVGKNGAGKSTLIDILLNAKKRDAGQVTIFNKDNIEYDQQIKMDIGFLIDNADFSKDFKLNEVNNVLRHIYNNWDSAYFFQLLKSFGLDDKAQLGSLSKGMLLKSKLATSMAHNPKLLILDEVTSGLDPVSRLEILDILASYIANDPTRSIIFSTHITDDLRRLSARVGFLDSGSLVFVKDISAFSQKSLDETMFSYAEDIEVNK